MLPAIGLVATPGRRRAALELAQEIERRGFAGMYVPSFFDGMGLCEALALSTNTTLIGTAIANIYTRHPSEYAATAALIHELSGGRFVFGVGVSHGPVHQFLQVTPGRPLTDMRRFVEALGTSRTTGGTGTGGPGQLPNYRNYWIEAGYEEEMRAIEATIAAGDTAQVPELMSERWLQDVTLYGSAAEVRDGVEAWRAAGVKTPILVPSSTSGGQFKAVEELLAAFA